MTPTRALSARALSGVAALALSVGGAVGAFVVTAGPASAGTTTVTNTADDGSATSLRGVLESATDGDVVVLTAGATYQLTICDPPEIHSAEGSFGWGDVEITGAVTIVGNGATIEQTCEDRVLYTEDALTLQDVTVTGGLTKDPGGGLFENSDSPVTLSGATFTDNESGTAGGGVATSGDVAVTNSTFTDNHATSDHGDGGGLKVFSDAATVTIDGSTFSANTASGWGGGFEQAEEIGGVATDDGLFHFSLTNSTFAGNVADSDGGGGIDFESDAIVAIDHSTVSGNTGGHGGGVGSFTDLTTFTANASTFSGNSTDESGSAVYLSGPEVDTTADGTPVTTAVLTNSTVTANTEGAFGAVTVGGALGFNHVTMTDNTSLGELPEVVPELPTAAAHSRDAVGSLAVDGDAANVAAIAFVAANSVVAQPHGAVNCVDFAIATSDVGYNFSDDASCGFTAPTSNVKTPNDPGLGPLANNGGPTQTLLPQVGSPLLDAIPPAACGAPVDQRGVTRPQGTGCDIGAVEVEVVAPAPAAVVAPKFTG